MLVLLNDTLTTTVSALEDTPGIDPVHERLLNDTLVRYERLLRQPKLAPEDRYDIAKGSVSLAWVMDLRFDPKTAQRLCRSAVEALETQLREEPANDQLQYDLANGYLMLGTSQAETEPLERAVELMKDLVTRYPKQPQYVQQLNWCDLFLIATTGLTATSLEDIRSNCQVWQSLRQQYPKNGEYSVGWAGSHQLLGRTFMEQAAFDDAESALLEAERTFAAVRDGVGRQTRYRIARADGMRDLGTLYLCRRRAVEAEGFCRQAVAELQQIGRFPTL